MSQGYDNTDAVVLEGVYKSIANSVNQVRQSVTDVQEAVSKELQYNSAQQMSAYESLVDAFEQGLASVRAELRYLSQQNSTIYENNEIDSKKLRIEMLDAVKKELEAAEKKNAEKIDEALQELALRQEEQFNQLRSDLISALTESKTGVQDEEVQSEATTETTEPEAAEEDVIDYDVLAEKIASVLPEIDYEMLSDKVVSAIPQTDAEAIAEKVTAAIGTVDENAIADKVAEAVPLIDYDLIAERVAEVLKNEEKKEEEPAEAEGGKEEKIAALVEEKLDYERIAARVAELLKGSVLTLPLVQERPEKQTEEFAVAEEPAPQSAPVVIVPPAPVEEAPITFEEPEENSDGMAVRYKYSFTAKIITSDMDVKQFYSRLKNEFMSYPKTSSQINWANDRFSYDNETIAKVAVRGKTLCLYLALDPGELPESVYHQTFAGDMKMYEKTPTMVKIKSGVALKRAIRLIGLLMEKNGVVQEKLKTVDYASQYVYRSEEQLLQEGLVKAVLVDKTESDFVRQ